MIREPVVSLGEKNKGAVAGGRGRRARPSPGQVIPGLVVAALGWLSGPWLCAEAGLSESDPPLHPALAGLLLGLVLVSGARCLLEVVMRRRVQCALAEQRRLVGLQVAEFARAVIDPKEVGRAVACFSSALANSLGLDGAALYLKGEGASELQLASAAGTAMRSPVASGAMTEVAADVVADGSPPYGRFHTSLPLVADGTEFGRAALGRPSRRRRLEEPELALAALLCGQLALALRNAQYRALVASQRDELEALIRRAEAEVTPLREEIRHPEKFGEIIGTSAALRRALALVERMAPGEVSILVTGETGTGKELVVRAVHALSPRGAGPLVTVNCPAIPGPLAESELFGHERGAFTDAVAARPGQFELADGGTIFLDEVADLPLEIQAKLLRVLQEHEVRRVGGPKARPIDVRAVAATNRDLLALVREGRFREDLYYRLAAVEVALPPLRDRHGDVPILATFFLDQAARASDRNVTGFSAEALSALCGYSWPGNVRQLQNAVRRAVLLCSGEVVRPSELSEITASAAEKPPNFGDAMRQEKRRRFLNALHQVGWNQSAAARLLGMSRSNFARMLRTLDITVPRRGSRHTEAAGRDHQ